MRRNLSADEVILCCEAGGSLSQLCKLWGDVHIFPAVFKQNSTLFFAIVKGKKFSEISLLKNCREKFLRYLGKSAKNGLWKSLQSQSLFEKVNFQNFDELYMLTQIRIQFSNLDKNINWEKYFEILYGKLKMLLI